MRKQHDVRRWIVGSLLVLAAAWAALGSGLGASAEIKTTKPRPDYASREEFRSERAALGGMFIDSGTTIRCEHQNGKAARIAAELRSAYGLRTPDSLQIAACLANGAAVFVTNDRRLRRVEEIDVLVLDDFV